MRSRSRIDHVEQVPDAARHALEEPDVRDRHRELDVAEPLAAHLGLRHLDAAAIADHAAVADALVLAAVALPVLDRTEDLLAEQAVLLGLERAVVDRLRLRHLAVRPAADHVRRGEPDADRVEQRRGGAARALRRARAELAVARLSGDCSSVSCMISTLLGPCRRSASRASRAPTSAIPLRLPRTGLQAQALQFLDQHVERLGHAGLGRILALDDRLVDARPAARRRPTSR